MGVLQKIKDVLANPCIMIPALSKRGLLNWLNDETYYKLTFRVCMGYKLNFAEPKTFSEKMHWLKLNDRKPVYNTMVDKYEAKKYVSDLIGEQYIIPTIGVWDTPDEIDFDELPEQFVLKNTHDSGGIVICKDKKSLNVISAKEKLKKSLKHNYFWTGREWPYKNLTPRVIAEEYLENDSEGLHDYKVWCFNGEPCYIQYISGRIGNNTYEAFYDKDWVKQKFNYHNPLLAGSVSKPERLQELLDCSRKLAQGSSFLRVDFYILSDGTLRFGELTFYPMSGLEQWHPKETDRILGEMIKLP